jgi:hypothetical protein
VELTEGLVKPSTLTWNGSRRKAPETPPIDVKKEMINATISGTPGKTSIPETGKYMIVYLLSLK